MDFGTDDRNWLENNFGQFRFQASLFDFLTFKNNFNGVSAVFKILKTFSTK